MYQMGNIVFAKVLDRVKHWQVIENVGRVSEGIDGVSWHVLSKYVV